MFGFGDDDDEQRDWKDILSEATSKVGRSQDESCDFCGSSEGSVVVNRNENHPDVGDSPPVHRCRECFNDPSTYPDDE